MSVNIDLVRKVEKNEKVKLIAAISIYLKLVSNILSNPQDDKYKKFKKNNPRISRDLLSVDGMIEILIESGFENENEEFVLKKSGIAVISKLKNYHEFFKKRIEDYSKISEPQPPTGSKPKVIEEHKIANPLVIKASKPFHDRIRFPQVLKSSNQFIRSLENLSDSVLQYEDKTLQESALKLIPVEKFKLTAIEKLRKIQKLIIKGEIKDSEPSLDDLILEELATWFKNDFFTWVNSAPCRVCKSEKTQPMGTSSSNGVRVEAYLCNSNNCNTITHFPRYNDIEKLLVTRSGRCGEFANCFTFLCRCLGYDARYVYCTSDHVWTEVYNYTKKRWIHVDPSENVFDSPLMYEAGWKRNLEYVIAFSKDDAQDVSWRYSSHHNDLLKRRKMCSEKELIHAMLELRKKRQSSESKARKKFLNLRTLAELGELLIQREPNEDEKKGRTSGSLAWRLARGETLQNNFHVFRLNEEENTKKIFNLRFSCAKNSFQKLVDGKVVDSVDDFNRWCFNISNIFRKVEHDHKMVYLARTEESKEGSFQLKFDFGDKKIQNLRLKLDLTTFHSGKAEMKILDENDQKIDQQSLNGRSKFSILVHVSGGNGDCAWQHAQIFRQSLNSGDYPMEIFINFS